MLSGRGLCDELITRPEESYRLWCVVVCDLETSSRMRRPWPALGCSAIGKKKHEDTMYVEIPMHVGPNQGMIKCHDVNNTAAVLVEDIPVVFKSNIKMK